MTFHNSTSMPDGTRTSTTPSMEPLNCGNTPVHDKLRLLSARINEIVSLRQRQDLLVEQSANRKQRYQRLTDDLITLEIDQTHQIEQVELHEREVQEAETTLAKAREKLLADQNLLTFINERKTDIQNKARALSEEREEEFKLKGQLAATAIEGEQLVQELTNTYKQFCQQSAPKSTLSVSTGVGEAEYILVSDLPASSVVSTARPASERNNEYDMEISEDEDDGHAEAELSYDAGAADDSDYTETRPSSSSKPKPARRRDCHRCKERGFRCDKVMGDNIRICARCRTDNVVCSYRTVSKGHHRGRQPNEAMNAHLKELLEVQKLSFQQIRESGVFGDTSMSAMRVRYRRLKEREEEVRQKTDSPVMPSQVYQEPPVAW